MNKQDYWKIDCRLRMWHPVALSSDLTNKPLKIEVCSTPIVLFRSNHRIVGLYDRCAHRRMPLSKGSIRDGKLICPYHGCCFNAKGKGFCPTMNEWRYEIPVFSVREEKNVIWVKSASKTESEIDPKLKNEGYIFGNVIQKVINAPLQLVVDNMTELEHTGAVHKKLAFGISGYDNVETKCSVVQDTINIYYAGPQRQLPTYLRFICGIKNGDYYVQDAEVNLDPPHAAYYIRWTKDKLTRSFGLKFVIYYTEINKNSTSLFSFVYWKSNNPLKRSLMKIFQPIFISIVSGELGRDQKIIESLVEREGDLRSFSLNKYDKPLAHTRSLMSKLYNAENEEK